MKVDEKDLVILHHMLDAINSMILVFNNMTKYTMEFDNPSIKDALLMQIIQIGELTKHLSTEFKSVNKGVPWSKLLKTRNIGSHDYAAVDWDLIVNLINREISRLHGELLLILDLHEKEPYKFNFQRKM